MAPAALGVPVVVKHPIIGVGQGATKPVVKTDGRRVFRLSEVVREGTLHDELQELYKKLKKPQI